MVHPRIKKGLIILRRESPWRLLYNHCRVTWIHIRQQGGLSTSFIWSPTRYLRPYIGHSLTHGTRRDIVILQALHLQERVRRSFFLELVQPRDALWRQADERCYSIWLSANPGRHLEGDLELAFRLDGIAIYTLSFSIGPNLAHPASGDVAMLVGRVQGERGHFDDIRLATKNLNDISPAALLVSAAEGIALALNLSHICGVAGSEQLARLKPGAEYFDYDSFWESLSGRRIGGWYQFDAPFLHKPPSQTATDHRRRARQRRMFRDAVREGVRAAFVQRFVRQDVSSTSTMGQNATPARWTDHRLVPWAALVAPLAFAAFYWWWPNDLIPDQTRYGRVDDVAVAFICSIFSLRVVTAWRNRAARPGDRNGDRKHAGPRQD